MVAGMLRGCAKVRIHRLVTGSARRGAGVRRRADAVTAQQMRRGRVLASYRRRKPGCGPVAAGGGADRVEEVPYEPVEIVQPRRQCLRPVREGANWCATVPARGAEGLMGSTNLTGPIGLTGPMDLMAVATEPPGPAAPAAALRAYGRERRRSVRRTVFASRTLHRLHGHGADLAAGCGGAAAAGVRRRKKAVGALCVHSVRFLGGCCVPPHMARSLIRTTVHP